MKFKIGDRVTVSKEVPCEGVTFGPTMAVRGKMGTIIGTSPAREAERYVLSFEDGTGDLYALASPWIMDEVHKYNNHHGTEIHNVALVKVQYLTPFCIDAAAMYKSRRHRPLKESAKTPTGFKIGDSVTIVDEYPLEYPAGTRVDQGNFESLRDRLRGLVGEVVENGNYEQFVAVRFEGADLNFVGFALVLDDTRPDVGFFAPCEVRPTIPDAAKMYRSRRHRRPLTESTRNPKFEVGDRVRLVRKWTLDCGYNFLWLEGMNKYLGKTGVIHRKSTTCDVGYSYFVDFGDGWTYWGYPEDALEPEIPDAAKMYRSRRHRPTHESVESSGPKFKVGDKVRMTHNWEGENYEYIWMPRMEKYLGEVGTITEVEDIEAWQIYPGNYYVVDFGGDEDWSYPEEVLEHSRLDPSVLYHGRRRS